MKILLQFMGLGLKDEMQAFIKIWNREHNFYYDGITYNGEIALLLNSESIYHLYASSCFEVIDLSFYVDKNQKKYVFYFPRSLYYKANKITFQLSDKYFNMPIEKGELILWQK